MRKIQTFGVVGGDLRSAFLAEYLAEDGFVVLTCGLDEADLPHGVTACTTPEQAIGLMDCIILPLPVTVDDKAVHAPFSRSRITLEQVLNTVSPAQYVFGGQFSPLLTKQFEERGVSVTDYLLREDLAIYNAVPTAEGAVQLAMEELPITISSARCLITGYGHVGRTLSRLLVAFGARVTVSARRFSDLAWAHNQNCGTLPLSRLEEAEAFDVIFNTVPARIFTEPILRRLSPQTLLIDLASKPGGVDWSAAANLQLKTIWALSLPGRVAPKTAGHILRNTVFNALQEKRAFS